MDNLNAFRKRLDGIDAALTKLLIERFSLSVDIGMFKRDNALDVYDPRREEIMLKRFDSIEDADLREAVIATYKSILDESKKLQKNL